MSKTTINDLFIEYFLICDAKKKNELIKNATIVLDTNVLLNCYRWSKNTAKEFLKVLQQIKKRIWLPYHVLHEFFKKRLDVIQQKRDTLKKLIEDIGKIIKTLEETRELKTHDFAEEKNKLIEVKESISHKIGVEIPDKCDDWILETITNLFKDKYGQPFPEEKCKAIIQEGKERYKKKIPPGYKDQNKDDNIKFNDLFIWKEIISYAKKNKKDVIFITDDQKEDWWWLDSQAQKISPRPELIKEFYNDTGQLCWIYTSDRFLETIKSVLELEITDKEALEKAIKEIKETEELHKREYLNLTEKLQENLLLQHERWKKAFEEYLMLPSKMLQDYYKLQEKLQRQQEEIREHLKSFYTFSTLTKQKATNDKDGEKEEEDR